MDGHKVEFIKFLLATGALKVGGEHKLKSQRTSPYFVNIGDFNTSHTTAKLGEAYAASIKAALGEDIRQEHLLYGIPEKGVGLAIATSIGMNPLGINMPWFFTRKVAKTHGEATAKAALTVGKAPKDGDRIVQLDDVFTAGTAKYEARTELMGLGNFELPLLAIAVDRQEVGIDGTSAIDKYVADTGTRVSSIVSATDILEFFKNSSDENAPAVVRQMENYLRVYGTKAARSNVSKLEQTIIGRPRSVIPACDTDSISVFEDIVSQTASIPSIGGYKVGFELGLSYGLPEVVEAARRHTSKPIIYDHQKAATDIPDTGKNFAKVCKKAGIDAIILFPQAGPETERAWIYNALDQGLKVIVGGRMTHPAYAQSEGGFISDEGAMNMYRIAAQAGVNHFVVPGNKLDVIKQVKELVEAEGVKPVFYSPGLVTQGGDISEAAAVAGDNWHAIVGRAILGANDYRAAAREQVRKL